MSGTYATYPIVGGSGGGGGGDVVGPASAVNDNVVAFDGTTGKLIKDSGVSSIDLVHGTGTVTADTIVIYSGTSGNLLGNSGTTIADLIAAAGSTCWKLDGSNTGSGNILGLITPGASFDIRTAFANEAGNAGNVTMQLGDSNDGAGTPNIGGSFFINTGGGWTGNYRTGGALIRVYGGDGTLPGDLNLYAGNVVSGDTSNTGGKTVIRGGSNATGSFAQITLSGTGESLYGDIDISPAGGGVLTLNGTQIYASQNLSFNNGLGINFYDSDNSNFVQVKAPNAVNTSYTIFWPTDPSPGGGYVLTDAGSNQLEWTAIPGGFAPINNPSFTGTVNITGLVSAVLTTDGSGNIVPVPSGTVGPLSNNGGSSYAYMQYSGTGDVSNFTANASLNAVFAESTWTGSQGGTAYTIGDIVTCLKYIYAIAA